MTLYRPALKGRAWWDTDFSRAWQMTGMIARLWGRHFAPVPYDIPANDRDSIRW